MKIDGSGKALPAICLVFLIVQTVTAGQVSMGDTLAQNQRLRAPQALKSEDGRFTLAMQEDGNPVVYDSQGRPLWSSSTDGHTNARLLMEDDGRVVLYAEDGMAFWVNGQITPNAPGRE